MSRNRILYFLLVITTIIVGLASRKFAYLLPDFINLGLGDALWALMMYWIIGFIVPRLSIRNLAIATLAICFVVELSQLWQTDWLNAIRNNRFGALVLGRGFLWSDLIAYSLGVGMGVLLEYFFLKSLLQNKKHKLIEPE
jgi:ABC-type phosphate transport system permease subunit